MIFEKKENKSGEVLEALRKKAEVHKSTFDTDKFSALNKMILRMTADHDSFMVNDRYYNVYYNLKRSDSLEGDVKYALDILAKDVSLAYNVCSDFYYDSYYELNDVMAAFNDFIFERYSDIIDEKILKSIISMSAYNMWHG